MKININCISSHYLSLTTPFYVPLRDSRCPGPYRATTCRGRKLISGSHTYFSTTQGHGGPPRTRGQLNTGATSETAQTWKTIHTRHTLIHSNKANMKLWIWWPNDIRRPCVPKVSWHLSYRWGKIPKKPHPGNLSGPGVEPGPPAWQARMLPTCNEIKQWMINKTIITAFIKYPASPHSAELGIPRVLARLNSVTPNKRFIHGTDGWALFTVQEKVCMVHIKKFSLKNQSHATASTWCSYCL